MTGRAYAPFLADRDAAAYRSPGMRRAFALLGVSAALLVAWLALLPSPAVATVDGGCTARIGGVNVTRGHDSADTAVPLESGERVPVAGTAPERVGDLSYTVHVAGGGVQVGNVTIAQDGLSWRGNVDLENISNATVGVFEVTAEVQNVAGEEICTGVAFVCVEGRSPFTTAAGAGATAVGVGGGILLVLALVRAPRMGVARTGVQGFAGGAVGGSRRRGALAAVLRRSRSRRRRLPGCRWRSGRRARSGRRSFERRERGPRDVLLSVAMRTRVAGDLRVNRPRSSTGGAASWSRRVTAPTAPR